MACSSLKTIYIVIEITFNRKSLAALSIQFELQTHPMLVQLVSGQVLALGFYLHVPLFAKSHSPISHSMIPQEVAMSSQLLLAVSKVNELLKVGPSIGS